MLCMPSQTPVKLRARTDADFDVLFAIAAELDTWEERNPSAPAPLARSAFEARLAQTEADSAKNIRFVIDAAGEAVGSVSLFGVDGFARYAEVGIALLAEFRGKGIGAAAIAQIVESRSRAGTCAACKSLLPTSPPSAPMRRRGSSSRGASASTPGSAAGMRTSWSWGCCAQSGDPNTSDLTSRKAIPHQGLSDAGSVLAHCLAVSSVGTVASLVDRSGQPVRRR